MPSAHVDLKKTLKKLDLLVTRAVVYRYRYMYVHM